jgi:hypothetical protein
VKGIQNASIACGDNVAGIGADSVAGSSLRMGRLLVWSLWRSRVGRCWVVHRRLKCARRYRRSLEKPPRNVFPQSARVRPRRCNIMRQNA